MMNTEQVETAPLDPAPQGNQPQDDDILSIIQDAAPDSDETDAPPDDGQGDEADDAPSDEPKQEAAKAGVSDDTAVKLQDGREVSVRELKASFETFTQKTQTYADNDRAREQAARSVIADVQENASQQIVSILQSVNDLVLPGVTPEYLNRLSIEDPARANELYARYRAVEMWRENMFRTAQDLQNSALQQRTTAQQAAQQETGQRMQSEAEKLKSETWYTQDFQRKARAYAVKHGIPERVAGAIEYAGMVQIVKKAMAYDAAKAQIKDGKAPPATKNVTPSRPARESTSVQQAQKLYEIAKKTGSRDATARTYASLLGG